MQRHHTIIISICALILLVVFVWSVTKKVEPLTVDTPSATSTPVSTSTTPAATSATNPTKPQAANYLPLNLGKNNLQVDVLVRFKESKTPIVGYELLQAIINCPAKPQDPQAATPFWYKNLSGWCSNHATNMSTKTNANGYARTLFIVDPVPAISEVDKKEFASFIPTITVRIPDGSYRTGKATLISANHWKVIIEI
jgi:hypothetical protein